MDKRPHILLTNDDGIAGEGLKALWESLHEWADVTIVAPATEKSGSGASLTIYHPLTIEPVVWEGVSTKAWKVSGTPADCVRLALSVVLSSPPDCILSGINRGSNAGRNILSSGTVGGAIEGTLRGIPALALSCIHYDEPNFHLAKELVPEIVRHCLKHKLPRGTFLNINFPSQEPILGLKLARQGRGFWKEAPESRVHPEGHSYYWLGGKWSPAEEHEESDVHLLSQGFAAAVPIHIDELTDHSFLLENKEAFAKIFSQTHITE